jgi:hypothetical protein
MEVCTSSIDWMSIPATKVIDVSTLRAVFGGQRGTRRWGPAVLSQSMRPPKRTNRMITNDVFDDRLGGLTQWITSETTIMIRGNGVVIVFNESKGWP